MLKLRKILVTCFSLMVLSGIFMPAYAADNGKAPSFDCDKFYDMFTVKNLGPNKVSVDTVAGLPKICTASEVGAIVLKTLFGFAGIVAVIFIMIGGYWYLTAAGNEEQSEKGQKALTSAVIGLTVILMSYAIVTIVANFITSKGSPGTTTPATPAGSQTTGREGGGGGGTPPAAEQGTRLSNDPNSMYYYITDADVRDDKNVEVVSGTVKFPDNPAMGGQFVSTITPDNKQAILNVYKACGMRMEPSFGFSVSVRLETML